MHESYRWLVAGMICRLFTCFSVTPAAPVWKNQPTLPCHRSQDEPTRYQLSLKIVTKTKDAAPKRFS